MARLRWIPWAVGTWVIGSFLLIALGVTAANALATTAVVVIQGTSGIAIWSFLVGRRASGDGLDRLELLGMGLAVGTLLGLLSGVIFNALLPWRIGWAVPALVALVMWIWSLRGKGSREARLLEWRRPSLIAFGVALVAGLGSMALNLTRYPLNWSGTLGSYHRDMLYFEALSNSVGIYGPNDSIFMSGAEIRYHWFVYAWAGQITDASGAEPFVVLTRVLPLVALVGCAALIVAWTTRMAGRATVSILAALLLVSGGYVGAANGTILNFDSPSQDLTTLWLLAFMLVFLGLLSEGAQRSRHRLLIAAAVLSVGMAGGKISTAAVALGAIGLVAAVGSVRRESWARTSWIAVAVCTLAAVVTYIVVVAGSASAGDLRLLSWEFHASSIQGMDLWLSPLGVALGTLGFVLAVSARWAGLAWLVADRDSRWRPEVVLGLGLVLVGLIPLIVLSQGVNETWFALSASAPLAALSAVGVGAAWHAVQSRAALILSIGVAGLVLLVVPVFWVPGPFSAATARFWGPWAAVGLALLGGLLVALATRRSRLAVVWMVSFMTILVIAGAGARAIPAIAAVYHASPTATGGETTTGTGLAETPTAPVMSPPENLLSGSPPDRTEWSSAEVEAADYLVKATVNSDVVVTNDTTSFLIPALTGRLTYMTGAPYQGLYGGKDSVNEIPARIATSLAFTRELDPEAFDRLCAAGVTWAWLALDGTTLRSWEPFATIEFSNDAVAIARIDRSLCR